jgi:hypothetical protein
LPQFIEPAVYAPQKPGMPLTDLAPRKT